MVNENFIKLLVNSEFMQIVLVILLQFFLLIFENLHNIGLDDLIFVVLICIREIMYWQRLSTNSNNVL